MSKMAHIGILRLNLDNHTDILARTCLLIKDLYKLYLDSFLELRKHKDDCRCK